MDSQEPRFKFISFMCLVTMFKNIIITNFVLYLFVKYWSTLMYYLKLDV